MRGGGNGLIVSAFSGVTGTIWQTGGRIVVTNTVLRFENNALMTGSNGTLLASNVFLSSVGGDGRSTFNINGSTNHVYANFNVGDQFCSGTGTVNMTSGRLFVTNAAGTATLDVRSGTLNISGGYVQADKIILTNICAHFTRTGGTLVYGSAVLDPTRDDDGDGYSNGFELSVGLDPLNPADINADNDGDGFSNIQEVLAGTDFNNANSAFRITSITRESNNLRIRWTTVGGRTNRVLFTTGDASGGYTNDFSNLSSFFIIPGTGESTTNYLDIGGATSFPSRYYRIRLVP
jgi:hypothetical protein